MGTDDPGKVATDPLAGPRMALAHPLRAYVGGVTVEVVGADHLRAALAAHDALAAENAALRAQLSREAVDILPEDVRRAVRVEQGPRHVLYRCIMTQAGRRHAALSLNDRVRYRGYAGVVTAAGWGDTPCMNFMMDLSTGGEQATMEEG